MATLTTNISNVSLTVSGTTQQSATISWTCPSVPSGSTISSCTLTGTATASMSKGSATITVKGQTVYSGSPFTINLGTGNTTSSVTATAKGGNKNAAGTVTLSNLVYTVNYTEPVTTYTVTFVDWDGTVLKTETVESGKSATAPTNPTRDGYVFTGWDKAYTNITSNLTVTAQYSVIIYTVTFLDYDGAVLKTEEVAHGGSATAPEVTRNGYAFTGWSVDFTNVTSNITTMAQYEAISMLAIKENGTWVNIPKIYKNISGVWIEQVNSSWINLFNSTVAYIKKGMPIPTAILYSDGTLTISDNDSIDNSHGNAIKIYTGWHTTINSSNIPWDAEKADVYRVHVYNVGLKYISYLFANLNNATNIDFVNFDISNATDMSWMFGNSPSLTSVDLSSLNTSNVTTMRDMFNGCSSLASLVFGNIDTSNVTNVFRIFANCSKLTSLDLSGLNTSNVTDMYGMFNGCSSLASLVFGNIDTSNVTTMGSMFNKCSSLTSIDLSNFNTSNVTNMSSMFGNCSSLTSIDLSSFNTSNTTNMSRMFRYCSNLTSVNLSSFYIDSNTEVGYMFDGCTNPNLTIYVKDETTKTKIESSTNFPSTATVVVGSPN